MNIRLLKANEIEVRVQSTKKTGKGVGSILLLYKDARVDQKILDEVFGILGWEREHQLINGNLFCTVRVWDADKKMWISKQDVGTESNTEKEKGQASDSFKRACFNLGIGRELYTAPFIWINLNSNEYSEYNGKIQCSAKFHVKSIDYNEEKEIVKLDIVDSKNIVRFSLTHKIDENVPESKQTSRGTNTLTDNKQASNSTICCEDCNKKITEKVAIYSTSKYGKKLCMDCQKKEAKAV